MNSPRFLRFLESKIDLGGLFIGAARGEEDVLLDTLKTLKTRAPGTTGIRSARARVGDLQSPASRITAAAFTSSRETAALLAQSRGGYFSRSYPCELVRTVQDETRKKSLGSVFPDLMVEVDTPFLSHDKLLFGEIVSFVRTLKEGVVPRLYALRSSRRSLVATASKRGNPWDRGRSEPRCGFSAGELPAHRNIEPIVGDD